MNVETLADEYLERLRSGAKPSIEEYAARYPSLAGEIREFFPALQLVERYKPNSRDGLSGDRCAVPREAFMPRLPSDRRSAGPACRRS